ncbi:MAG TPA: glycerate kinase [Parasulfuritortus sp.]
MDIDELLSGSFQAAVAAVQAETVLPPHLPYPPAGRTLVVGAGKASAAMAATVESHWPDDALLDGLVITRYGYAQPTRRIQVIEAGHPLPDSTGTAAAESILRLVQSARPEDQVLALISGGASSLLTLPAEGLALDDVAAVSRALLLSGAPIADINCVRKHLSRTLGGQLAEACKAPVHCLMLSDVTGDDPAVIGSGPFTPDPTTFADALVVLAHWQITPPPAIRHHLERGAAGAIPDTPKPGSSCFDRVESCIIANGRTALLGAADYFERQGIKAVILGDTVTGESREVAGAFAALAREIRQHGSPWPAPVALLSGGETTVTVRGSGRGGRNTEFALAMAVMLDGMEGVHVLAADTDGIDGTEANVGAFIGPDTLAQGKAAGMDASAYLHDNDSYGYFAVLGALLMTGPTMTNVNDYRVVLVL